MTLEDAERLALELEPEDRLRLADHIYRELGRPVPHRAERGGSRRERMFAALAECDRIAESIGSEFDAADDLRKIRADRAARISQ